MTETELENLVVRLTGDASGFINMLKNAEAEAKSFAAKVTETLAAVAQFAGFRGSMNSFVDFQDNLIRLETTVKANGLAAEKTMAEYKEFANVMEETTRYSATATIGLLSQAHAFGLVGEEAQKAVRMAIGLSQGRPGVAPGEALRALSMLMRGKEMAGEEGGGRSFGMFYLARILGLAGRDMGMGMGMGGRGGGKMQEKMMKEINKQLKIAEEISKKLGESFGGQLARIKSYLQDIGVELGGIVSKWLEPFVKKLGEAVKWFKELDPGIKRVVTALFGLATVLTAGGPIIRFFMLLLRLATSISPITAALVAATGAMLIWIKSVGGLQIAWQRAYNTVINFLSTGIGQIRKFIGEHQRLVMASVVTASAIAVVTLTIKILMSTLTMINGVLTVLHIKQVAIRAITLSWRAATIAASLALLAIKIILGAGGLLTHLAILAVSLTTQIIMWGAYRAAILTWRATVYLATNGMTILTTAMNAVVTTFTTAQTVFETVTRLFRYGLVMALRVSKLALALFVEGIEQVLRFGRYLDAVLTTGFSAIKLSAKGLSAILTGLGAALNVVYAGSAILASAATSILSGGLTILIGIMVLALGQTFLLKAATWLLSTAYTVLTFAIAAVSAAIMAGYNAAMTAATLATGAAAGAVGGLSALLGYFGAAFVVAFGAAKTALGGFLDILLAVPANSESLSIIGGIFSEWAGYIMDAYHAMTLSNSAIKEAKEQMGEVGDELKKISTGMDLAWEMGKIGFQIMVREMQLAWPPLWEYMQIVAGAAWETLRTGWTAFVDNLKPPFKLAFMQLWQTLKAGFAAALRSILYSIRHSAIGEALPKKIRDGLSDMIDNLEGIRVGAEKFFDEKGMDESIDHVKREIQELQDSIAVTGFRESKRIGLTDQLIGWNNILKQLEAAKESSRAFTQGQQNDMAKAKESMNSLANQIKQKEKEIADAAANAGKKISSKLAGDKELKDLKDRYATMKKLMTLAGKAQADEAKKADQNIDLSQPFKKAEKEIHKWEATLFGSAEAFSRWQEYLDKIDDNALEKATEKATEAASKGEGSAPTAVEGGMGGGGAKAEQHGDKVEQLLEKIFQRLNKPLNVRIENGAPSKIK